jgi:hypothetical protein
MKIFTAISLYSIIPVLILQNWLLLAAIAVVIFSARYGAVLLIPLAILIDGYFGNFYTIPYLSFLATVWYVLVEYLRPRVMNRNLWKYE